MGYDLVWTLSLFEIKVCPPFKLFLLKKYKLEQSDDEKSLINTNWSSQKLCGYLKIQTGALWWQDIFDKYKVEQGSKYKLEHIIFCGYVCKFFGRQNLKCIKLLTNFGKININWSSCLWVLLVCKYKVEQCILIYYYFLEYTPFININWSR